MGFNPRSPRGGATIKFVKSSIVLILFQSTLPTRGSDFNFRSFFKPDYGFNPRSPRGGATILFHFLCAALGVSIHAPHEGERPLSARWIVKGAQVSIHAPHEGERRFACRCVLQHRHGFNPRSPRGGATTSHSSGGRHITSFQSTLPTRGSDKKAAHIAALTGGFNPRSPRGGATI